jgi:hypothetical protein
MLVFSSAKCKVTRVLNILIITPSRLTEKWNYSAAILGLGTRRGFPVTLKSYFPVYYYFCLLLLRKFEDELNRRKSPLTKSNLFRISKTIYF